MEDIKDLLIALMIVFGTIVFLVSAFFVGAFVVPIIATLILIYTVFVIVREDR